MNIIFETKFGSHLYGTNTPSSDQDFKGIFVPSAQEIIAPRIPDVKTFNTGDKYSKNSADDIDREYYAVHKFFDMLKAGDMVAYELLFAPAVHSVNPIYNSIRSNRDRLVSRECKGFLGYCRRQANNYSVKGERLNAVKRAVDFFDRQIEKFGTSTKINQIPFGRAIFDGLASFPHCSIEYIRSQEKDVWHFVCCDRKVPDTVSLKTAYDTYKRVLDEYGNRARMAADANGVDWKALSHAIRVGEEACEFLETGYITFPRPNAQYLLDIKLGNVAYKNVTDQLNFLLEKVEKLAKVSKVREKPDLELMQSIQEEIYFNEIYKTFEVENERTY